MVRLREDEPPDGDSRSTIALVARAKRGDRRAWDRLVERFYDAWLSRYHGRLGTEVRRLCDTGDLVQSAVADAFQALGDLRDESVFFTWVSAILRHKLALRYRENRRLRSLEPASLEAAAATNGSGEASSAVELTDTYLNTLDAIIAAFPERPRWMTAVVLRHLDGLPVAEVAGRLQIPERTAFHWVTSGVRLLGQRLSEKGAGHHDVRFRE